MKTVMLYNQTEAKTTQQNTMEKLSVDKQDTINQRGKMFKVFLFTWRSYQFCFSITSLQPLFFSLNFSLQGKGNHL